MLDLLVETATLPDGRTDMSLAVRVGLIVEAAPSWNAPTHKAIDAQGLLLIPPFCRSPLLHGRIAQLRPAARHLKRHAVGRHRAVERARTSVKDLLSAHASKEREQQRGGTNKKPGTRAGLFF